MLREDLLNTVASEPLNCAFVVKDLKTGERTAYNEDVAVPSASLIKIPIMLELFRQVKEGKLSLKQRITVRDDVKVPFSILSLLESGNSYSLKDVATLMIIQSDNTAANLLMDLVGMDRVNRYVKSLGLRRTVLQRKMMDAQARKEGRENTTSAGDMAKLFEIIYKSAEEKDPAGLMMKNILVEQLDNSMMRLDLPDETVIAHKTGDLDGISHDAGIVYLPNADYLFCALIWNAATNNLARKAIGKLSKTAYDHFAGLK